jgi:hypothetical protein
MRFSPAEKHQQQQQQTCALRTAVVHVRRYWRQCETFPRSPTLFGLLNSYSKQVGPQLLFPLHRVKIPIFVGSFDDLAASCLSLYLFAPVPGRLRREYYNFPALCYDVRFAVAFCGSGTVIERSSTKVKNAIEGRRDII